MAFMVSPPLHQRRHTTFATPCGLSRQMASGLCTPYTSSWPDSMCTAYTVSSLQTERTNEETMASTDVTTQTRESLSREKVLLTAVAVAARGGVEALSMRRVAQELGVVPMALYRHVANKDEMLDGMIDVVVGEIDPPAT